MKKNTVTFTIRCDTAVANGMAKDPKWAGIVPASGCILPVITMEFEEGETVFDLLCRIRDTYKLQMEYSGANGGQYIEGINNLYEFDGGRWSGLDVLCEQLVSQLWLRSVHRIGGRCY